MGTVFYQTLPLLQFFMHNVCVDVVKRRKGEGEPGNEANKAILPCCKNTRKTCVYQSIQAKDLPPEVGVWGVGHSIV